MRTPLLQFITTTVITTALPVLSSSLLPRSDVCANDGKTKVGTLFTGRDLSPSTLTPRAMPHLPCFWCQHETQTAISIKTFSQNIWTPEDAPIVLEFLNYALNQVRKQLHLNRDAPIPNGHFLVSQWGANWFAANENNHQLTWGVMGSAIEALTNFMVAYGFGPVLFTIYDGPNLVGRGLLQPDHRGGR